MSDQAAQNRLHEIEKLLADAQGVLSPQARQELERERDALLRTAEQRIPPTIKQLTSKMASYLTQQNEAVAKRVATWRTQLEPVFAALQTCRVTGALAGDAEAIATLLARLFASPMDDDDIEAYLRDRHHWTPEVYNGVAYKKIIDILDGDVRFVHDNHAEIVNVAPDGSVTLKDIKGNVRVVPAWKAQREQIQQDIRQRLDTALAGGRGEVAAESQQTTTPQPDLPTASYCLLPGRKVRWNDEPPIELQKRLWDLLEYLLTHTDYPLQQDAVEEKVWGEASEIKSKTFANTISRLNNALSALSFPWTWRVSEGQVHRD